MGKALSRDCYSCGANATLATYITSTEAGYHCKVCGLRWKSSSRYQWWPIRIMWLRNSSSKFFNRHGWQTGWDGFERRVFGQTFHIGALKICLGKEPDR